MRVRLHRLPEMPIFLVITIFQRPARSLSEIDFDSLFGNRREIAQESFCFELTAERRPVGWGHEQTVPEL